MIQLAKGFAWSPIDTGLYQIKAQFKKGKGAIKVQGDIGHDFLLALETAVELAQAMGIDGLPSQDLIITVPGTPNDTSVGLAIFLAIYAAALKQTLDPTLAYIGNINLSGMILKVDNLKQKLDMAARASKRGVLLPHDNMPEIATMAPTELYLGPVVTIHDAIAVAFK